MADLSLREIAWIAMVVVQVGLAAWGAGRYGWLAPRTPADRLPRARWQAVTWITMGFLWLLTMPSTYIASVACAVWVVWGIVDLLRARKSAA